MTEKDNKQKPVSADNGHWFKRAEKEASKRREAVLPTSLTRVPGLSEHMVEQEAAIEKLAQPLSEDEARKWGMRASWTPEEAAALWLGFSPLRATLETALKGRHKSADARRFLEYLEIVSNNLKGGTFGGSKIAPKAFVDWCAQAGDDCPKLLVDSINEMTSTTTPKTKRAATVNTTPRATSQQQAINTRNKIIAAWAKSQGWKPSDKRSPVTGKLLKILKNHGCDVSSSTLLEAIRDGVELLDEV